MANQGEPTYRVDRIPQVDEQIRMLAKKAAESGNQAEFFEALKQIIEKLENEPLEWGDPEYRTRHRQGWVCHGIRKPLMVRFVVFEAERIVMVLTVQGLPG